MAEYKIVNAAQLDADLESLADSIRAKAGVDDKLAFPAGMKAAVDGIPVEPPPKDVNFYDYDGRLLYSYTLEELTELSELPELPQHDGLVGQGWNWTLDGLKALNRRMNVGANYVTDDGKTRIHITLTEGRTFPILGCCVNGTVTVDWGDGSAPDVLSGEDLATLQWTGVHSYPAAGDYVISLTVDGKMAFAGESTAKTYSGILRFTTGADYRNYAYHSAVNKIEIGHGVAAIGDYAFYSCNELKYISVPESVASIGLYAFTNCYNLHAVVIPDGITSTGERTFYQCYSLTLVSFPDGFTTMGANTCYYCYSLPSVELPDTVTYIGANAFDSCYAIARFVLPAGVELGQYALARCMALSTLETPDGMTAITAYAFMNCQRMVSVKIAPDVTSIGTAAFYSCYCVRCYDFTRHTSVPALENKNAFSNIPADCEIRVPAALADEWKAAAIWVNYADYIVGV